MTTFRTSRSREELDRRWRYLRGHLQQAEMDEGQRMLVDFVRVQLDQAAGKTVYDDDLRRMVAEGLRDRIDFDLGDFFGTDVFYARGVVYAEQVLADDHEAIRSLGLVPGKQIGRLRVNGENYQRVSVETIEAETGKISLIGYRGNREWRMNMSAASLKCDLKRTDEYQEYMRRRRLAKKAAASS